MILIHLRLFHASHVFVKARQQQAELAQQEWLQMQQAAQQAQMAAASATAAQQAGSSQDEDEEDDIWSQDTVQLVWIPSWDSVGGQTSQCCCWQRLEMCLTAGAHQWHKENAHLVSTVEMELEGDVNMMIPEPEICLVWKAVNKIWIIPPPPPFLSYFRLIMSWCYVVSNL